MWDTTTDPAPAPASSGSPVTDVINGIFGLASKKLDQEALRSSSQQLGTNSTPKLGVNQDGVPFFAGKATFASGTIGGVPAPLVLVGVGILALAFILHGRGR